MHLNEIIKQKDYEEILAVIRRHPLTFVSTVILYVVLAAIPAALYVGLGQIAPDVLENPYTNAIVTLIFSAFELSVALFFYSSFLVYYLDMLIITNDRFVEVSQRNLFSRTVAEIDLYKIQHVKSEVTGVIPTLFNYGTITIETAGEQEIVFTGIRTPHELRRQLIQLSEEDRIHHADESAPTIHPQDIHP